MIAYLIKSGLCLAFLLGVYYLLLEREKMHRFNRFYLLFALVFGLMVPLTTIEIIPSEPVKQIIQLPADYFGDSTITADINRSPVKTEEGSGFPLNIILWSLYGCISLVMSFRFVTSLKEIYLEIKTSEVLPVPEATLVLSESEVTPHSFLKYIFIEKEEYRSGKIEQEILNHEMAHVQQKHSLDILFVEVLKVLFWFNPIIYFFKKAMQLNHEFLADELVVKSGDNIRSYQQLLLRRMNWSQKTKLASSFNYSQVKRRLMMMSKKKSKMKIYMRAFLIIPVLVLSLILFKSEAKPFLQVDRSYKAKYNLIPALTIKENPAREYSVLISFTLSERADVLFSIYTSEGEKLEDLVHEILPKGEHEMTFLGENMPRDNYKYLLEAKLVDGMVERSIVNSQVITGYLLTENGEVADTVRRISFSDTARDTLKLPPAPPPVKKEVPEELKKAGESYETVFNKYMEMDPDKSSMEDLEEAFQKVKEAAENLREAFRKVHGEDSIAPPVKVGPDPDKRKESGQKLKKLKTKQQELWKEYLKVNDEYTHLDIEKVSIEELNIKYLKLNEIRVEYLKINSDYHLLKQEIVPPPPPMPFPPEQRKQKGN